MLIIAIYKNKYHNKTMKKINFFSIVALAAIATIAMTSCNKQNPQVDDKPAAAAQPSGDAKFAYVEVDSIMSQYKFCKDYSLILQKKGQNIQNTLGQKDANLRQAAANFQQNIQSNKYTREQAEAIQANLQKQNADLQALNQRLSNEFQTETAKYNKALSDSIHNYLARYNKDKKYAMIFAKQGDNILCADKAYDITNEVIAGLNKAYKPAPAAKK